MPKVSVVIPVYGVEKYIEKCARSLFEQTLDDLEYIFVDDCSPDGSIAVIQKVLEEYPQRKNQTKIIHHEKNGGLVAARKTGLAQASGSYIIHCDSDDWVDPAMYETLYNQAVENNADMVYCDINKCKDTEIKRLSLQGKREPEALIKEILSGSSIGAVWNKLFKREIALDPRIHCPDHIIMAEDMLRVCQMLLLCNKICHIKQALYCYRQHSAQMTAALDHSKMESLFDTVAILEQKLGKRFTSHLNSRRRSLALRIIRRRLLSTGDFYKHFSGLVAGCFFDKNLTLFRKCVFFAGFCLYFLLPKNLQKDYETLSRQRKGR